MTDYSLSILIPIVFTYIVSFALSKIIKKILSRVDVISPQAKRWTAFLILLATAGLILYFVRDTDYVLVIAYFSGWVLGSLEK